MTDLCNISHRCLLLNLRKKVQLAITVTCIELATFQECNFLILQLKGSDMHTILQQHSLGQIIITQLIS